MMLRILLAVCWMARFAPALEPACTPVEGDRILGQHLAEALPAFRTLPPETLLGSTPPPGARRTFHAPELESIAQRYAIQLDAPSEVCFEWPMETLGRDRFLAAMQASLQTSEAQIEIAETSTLPVPRGRLEFPRDMLGKPASPAQKDPVLWRGRVVYGDHLYPVWARVWVKAPCDRFIAVEALKPGQAIDSRQVRAERGECFPSAQAPLSPVGLVPSRGIAAGAEIQPGFVAPPNDVNRGDAVQVEVRGGAVRLAFTAKAESGGRNGDFVAIRNPSSNRLFQARIEGKDAVVVQTESATPGP
jgi:flagella basal body P-ring formation protein FlgA